jgi:hypothetical protein
LLAFHDLFLFVKVADTQIASPQKRPEIRKLKNPGLDGTFGGIKALALKEDSQEHFLKDVFGFGPFAEDLESQRKNLPEIAMKEQGKAFFAAVADVLQQHIVRDRVAMVVRQHLVGEL